MRGKHRLNPNNTRQWSRNVVAWVWAKDLWDESLNADYRRIAYLRCMGNKDYRKNRHI